MRKLIAIVCSLIVFLTVMGMEVQAETMDEYAVEWKLEDRSESALMSMCNSHVLNSYVDIDHIKYRDGSCRIVYRQKEICGVCGYEASNKILKIETFCKCTHKN